MTQDAFCRSAVRTRKSVNCSGRSFRREIRQVDQQLDGVLAVAIKDLTSGDEFLVNGDEIMPRQPRSKSLFWPIYIFRPSKGKLALAKPTRCAGRTLFPGATFSSGSLPTSLA